MRLMDNLYGPDTISDGLSIEEIINDNEQKILNLIYGMTGDYHLAQDLTQDTFIKAFQSKQTFKGESKVSSWLYRIAVNTTIDHQRKSCVQREHSDEEMQSTPSSSDCSDPDQGCQKNAIKQILYSTIAKLPEQQREVFVLREVNGCTTKEVSEILDITQELVKWRLHKARTALRKLLKQSNDYKNMGKINLNGFGLE
ncbi:RNA polymerase sigma factor [Desulfotomaculum defluvii]